MDWVRSTLGITASTAPAKPHPLIAARSATPHDERAAALELSQTRQLRNMEDQLRDLNEDISRASRQPAVLRPLLLQRATLTQTIAVHKGKLENSRSLRQNAAMAEANVEQALLMQQAAVHMEENTAAMDSLHVEDTVDRLSDVAKSMETHNDLLSTPIFRGTGALIDDDDIDAQMAAIQAAEDEREAREADERMLMGALPRSPKQSRVPVRDANAPTPASSKIVE